jgi:hypothetical protein
MQHKPTNLSICIPRVKTELPRQYIFQVLSSLKIGFIDKIFEYPLKTDPTCKRVIVKFKSWVESPAANIITRRFEENKDIKMVYNEPWYWIAYKAGGQC